MASTLAPGTLLHGKTYRITRFLSRGGFGCTYEAEHILLGRHVALKELFVGDLSRRDAATGHVEPLDREKKALIDRIRTKFLEEARVLCNLRHPGIVNVSDLFEENGTAYYAMEFIVGQSLQEIVDRRGALPEREAAGYIRQVAEALRYVHSRHRLHLDIKPANVMVDGGGNAILIDFGVSKQYDEVNGLNTSTLMGVTPNYAPPEQVANGVGKFLPATDIYALGATLYTLLTGKIPASCVNRAFGQALDPLPAAVSEAVRRAVDQAMRLDLATRTADADAFLAFLTPSAPAADNRTKPATPSEATTPKPAKDPFKGIFYNEETSCDSFSPRAAPKAAESTTPKPARDPFEGIIYDARISETEHWNHREYPTVKTPATGNKAYDLVWPIMDGLIKVCKNGRYGFLDADRREVIPLIYEAAWNFRDGLARVRKNGGKYGFIDMTGKEVVPITYDNADDFKRGMAVVERNLKIGYVNKAGKEVVPPVYDGLKLYWGYSSDGLASVNKNEKYGVIDNSGRIVIPLEYNIIFDDFTDPSGFFCAKKDGKWGYIDTKGKVRIPFKYLGAGSFHAYINRAPVCKKSLMTLNVPKWGYIDEDGKTSIPFRYDDARPFGDCRRAPVAKDGKWGVIDDYGNQIVPFKYDYIDCFYHGYAKVLIDSGSRLWGIIDKSGREIVAPKYDAIFQVPEDHYMDYDDYPMVKKNGKYGFIYLSRGKEIAPCIYDFADFFERGFALVRQGTREFFIDRDGKEVTFS